MTGIDPEEIKGENTILGAPKMFPRRDDRVPREERERTNG